MPLYHMHVVEGRRQKVGPQRLNFPMMNRRSDMPGNLLKG
jgi:hypothetical protein